jgi:hypothetical protein
VQQGNQRRCMLLRKRIPVAKGEQWLRRFR